jgi:hypothetical protein
MDEYSEIPHYVFGPDQHRQGLARLVEDLFTWPIQSRRWRAIQPEVLAVLRARAEAYGTDAPHELLRAARAAFTKVLPTMGTVTMDGMNYDKQSFAAWSREVRRKINRQITEDLLGPDWRKPRAHVREAIPRASHGPEQDIAVEIRDLLSSERLSFSEREAFQAFLDCEGDRAAAARRLGLTVKTFNRRFERACGECRKGYWAG